MTNIPIHSGKRLDGYFDTKTLTYKRKQRKRFFYRAAKGYTMPKDVVDKLEVRHCRLVMTIPINDDGTEDEPIIQRFEWWRDARLIPDYGYEPQVSVPSKKRVGHHDDMQATIGYFRS